MNNNNASLIFDGLIRLELNASGRGRIAAETQTNGKTYAKFNSTRGMKPLFCVLLPMR